MNTLEQYNEALAKSKNRAILMTGIGALYNAKLISDTKNAPAGERLPTPILQSPYMTSPGPEMVNNINNSQLSRSGNANRDLVRAMGRPELAVGINDAESNAAYEIMNKGLMAEYEIMNKNQVAAAETSNKNALLSQEVRQANMTAQKEENIKDSETISQGINELYSMGINLSKILGQADALSLQAKKLYDEENRAKANLLSR